MITLENFEIKMEQMDNELPTICSLVRIVVYIYPVIIYTIRDTERGFLGTTKSHGSRDA